MILKSKPKIKVFYIERCIYILYLKILFILDCIRISISNNTKEISKQPTFQNSHCCLKFPEFHSIYGNIS